MRRQFVVLSAVALLVAACPGREPPPEALPPDPTPQVTPTECARVAVAEGAPAPLTMQDTFFVPLCIALSSTQSVLLSNAGDVVHNFTLAEGNLDVDVEPGEELQTDPLGESVAAGTYGFVCKFHEGQGMVGTIVVE